MQSRGFTLFEVLVSLVILSVLLLSLTKIYTQDDSIDIYYKLQNMENSYIETNTIISNEKIKLKQN